MRTTICCRVAVASRRRSKAAFPRLLPDVLPQQLAAVHLRQQRAGVERIDDQVVVCAAGFRRGTHEEVPGKIHPFELHAGAPADLEIHDRQADRNSDPAVEHFVEEAVARIVVVLAVAAEAELFVEIRIQRGDRRARVDPLLPVKPSGRRFTHPFEPLQVRRTVQRGILDAGNRQRRGRERLAGFVDRAQQIVRDPRQPCLQGKGHTGILR